jgi:spermidine synthase
LGWNLSVRSSGRERERESIHIYLAEAAGSALGGIVFYFLFMPFFSSFQISLLLSIIFLASGGLFSIRGGSFGKITILGSVLLLCLVGVVLRYSGEIDTRTRRLQWGNTFLRSTETPYHNLAFLERSDQFSLFANGLLLYAIPDRQATELGADLALLQHSKPERILVIGGCSPELIGEILKHPGIRGIDYVQPDSELLRFSRTILPDSQEKFLADSRVRIIISGANRFLKVAPRDYSVIILSSGEPVNAEMNRFYTVEFFSGIRELMGADSVFSFGVPCAPDIIGPREAQLLQCLSKTLKEVFGTVLLLPGEDSLRFFASKTTGSITKDPRVLIDRIRSRNLELQYVRDFFLVDSLSPMRLFYVDSVLEKENRVRINRDFEPVCYMYALSLWGAQLHPAVGKSLDRISGEGRNSFTTALFALAALSALVVRFRAGQGAAVVFNAGICGAILIMTELALILLYQIISGSMYKQMALIISMFMSGMALGSYLGKILSETSKESLKPLFLIQIGLTAYEGVLFGLFTSFERFLVEKAGSPMIFILFLFLALAAGILGGAQFGAAVCAKAGRSPAKGTGAGLYAADLIGASGGALAGSLFFMPVFGIPRTFLFLALAGFAGAITIPGRRRGYTVFTPR